MIQGLLLVNKPKGKTSFSLVSALRRLTGVQKIGHAGTLDPFAQGVMILLVGKNFTRCSDQFLNQDKEYLAELTLGVATDSYDSEGTIVSESPYAPTLEQVETALLSFQGTLLQTPPMFSAKKVDGTRLYELARKGISIEREAVSVTMHTEMISYDYPRLTLRVSCSKGTYIRSIAHDLGAQLTCGAYLSDLTRTRSGPYLLSECIDGNLLFSPPYAIAPHLRGVL